MTARRPDERKKSAQSFPVSGRQQAASRTMVPPILLTQNRHPHRRWRGRFAVLDPIRSLPAAASCLIGSGGQDDVAAAYRRASRRTRMERRSGRNPANPGRAGSSFGTAEGARLMARRGRHRQMSLLLCRNGETAIRHGRRGRALRQDKRNGAMPCGHVAATLCLHILFPCLRHGAISKSMAPAHLQHVDLPRYSMAPWRSFTIILGWRSHHG